MKESDNVIFRGVAVYCGLSTFFVGAWFVGGIYRNEQFLWVGDEYAYRLARHGQVDAIWTIGLYIVFYSIPFISTFLILWKCWMTAKILATRKKELIITITFISVWALLSFLFLFPSCAAFIRNIPDTWNGWLFIIWFVITALTIAVIFSEFKEKYK